MKNYIGNITTVVNCNALIEECLTHDVIPSHGYMELSEDNIFYNEYLEQTKALQLLGYNESMVEFRHYQSGNHFNKNVEIEFGNLVSATPLMCWISEVRPGKCVPWHWDINPWEEEHKKLGTLVRYFCFISQPQPGHIFVTKEDCYYNESQGTIYQYADIHDWHAGSNVGLVPKFLMTFTGFKKV